MPDWVDDLRRWSDSVEVRLSGDFFNQALIFIHTFLINSGPAEGFYHSPKC